MKIFTEKELATFLNVSPWTIRNWRLKAGLPFFGTAGRIFYRYEAVVKWMEQEEERNSKTSQDISNLSMIPIS